MSLIRKHVAVLQAWACLDLVSFASKYSQFLCARPFENIFVIPSDPHCLSTRRL